MCPLVDERLEDPPAVPPPEVTGEGGDGTPPPAAAPRQRARRPNGTPNPTKPGSPRPKPSRGKGGTKGAQPRAPRAKPPDLDTRIQVFKEAEGRCCVTGRLMDPLAYGRDWFLTTVDGSAGEPSDYELISAGALKLKGEGKGARTWDQLQDLLKARLDAGRALEREFGHLYPAGEGTVTLYMGGGVAPPNEE